MDPVARAQQNTWIRPNSLQTLSEGSGEDAEEKEERSDSRGAALPDLDELEEEEELAEGGRHEEELLSQYETWDDEDSEFVLDGLYERLEEFMNRELEYDFHLLDTQVPFASSCPNGAIYFTRCLLENLETEELLFLAAHELAHTELRHYASRHRRLRELRACLKAAPGSLVQQRFSNAAVLTVRHQEEFEADFQAGSWTGHSLGARTLIRLEKLCHEFSPNSLNRPTHPKFSIRAERLGQAMPFSDPLKYLYSLL